MLGVSLSVNAAGAQAVVAKMQSDRLEKILVGAIRKALRPVVSAVKGAAPIGKSSGHHLAGELRRSIRLRIDTRRGLRVAIAGAPQGHLVEYGHRIVIGGRAPRTHQTKFRLRVPAHLVGKVVGQVAPHPFAGPVVNAATQLIEKTIADDVVRELMTAARVSQATGIAL